MGPRTGCSGPGRVSLEQSRESPPSTCRHTLSHVHLFLVSPKSFSAGLLSIHGSPQCVLTLGIGLTHVQDLALGFVDLNKVHVHSLLKTVQVPLDGIPSLQCVNCATQLSVMCIPALNPSAYITDEDLNTISANTDP